MQIKNMDSQKGSALLISLVILTVLTLIAISSMQNATLEEQMTGNSQQQIELYNASLSELDAQFQTIDTDVTRGVTTTLTDALTNDISLASSVTTQHMANNAITKTTSITYLSDGSGGVRSGYSFNSTKTLPYEITTRSVAAGSGASSNQTIGVAYAAPGS